jgi:HTH-like domain
MPGLAGQRVVLSCRRLASVRSSSGYAARTLSCAAPTRSSRRRALFRPGTRPDPATVMSVVGAHRDRFGVEPILRVLEAPASTYYGWVAQQRHPCQRRRADQLLLARIRAVHDRSGRTYGAQGARAAAPRRIRVSRKRVARLVRAHGLQGAFLRKRWRCCATTDPSPLPRRPSPPLLDKVNWDAPPPRGGCCPPASLAAARRRPHGGGWTSGPTPACSTSSTSRFLTASVGRAGWTGRESAWTR